MQKTLYLSILLLSTLECSIFNSGSTQNHPQVSKFRSLPKYTPDQLRQLTQGFYSLMEMHAAQLKSDKPLGRVLAENNKHLFTEKIMNAVDGEIVGLKGDLNHSSKLTDNVGEILGTARGYFDKVKEAKQKLENPVGAIGDALKDSVGGALGNIGSSFGFRNLEGEKKEGNIYA